MDGTFLSSTAHAGHLGVIYGALHALGPDHIGTLIALSAAAGEEAAFRVGCMWGFTHSLGMVLVCAVFIPLHRDASSATAEVLAHYGNYIVGATMVLCAMYFIIWEASYMNAQGDGNILLATCQCHRLIDSTGGPDDKPNKQQQKKRKVRFCEYGTTDRCEHGVQPRTLSTLASDPEQAATPPLDESCEAYPVTAARSGLLGFLQGVCCPIGLVGISVAADLPTVGRMLVFLVIFSFVSALGTGVFSHCWARLVRSGAGGAVTFFSPMLAYRCSCSFTLLLGIVWMVANAFGILDQPDEEARGPFPVVAVHWNIRH